MLVENLQERYDTDPDVEGRELLEQIVNINDVNVTASLELEENAEIGTPGLDF